jgi:transcriptional regulator with XRE-family HTH domain
MGVNWFMTQANVSFDQPKNPRAGALIRDWRKHRRWSQLDLACEAEISQRHLSFLESGRAQPSREMVLLLAERLDLPLRERNALLVSAGFAPMFQERGLDDPALSIARAAVERVLEAHYPLPALAVDRHWNLVSANAALAPLLQGIGAHLLTPPVNVLRATLHPDGLSSRIINWHEWRGHVLERLRRQYFATADAIIDGLIRELSAYPTPPKAALRRPHDAGHLHGGIAVPLRLRSETGELNFISTTTVFGTAVDITLAELTLETFFPADAATAAALQKVHL